MQTNDSGRATSDVPALEVVRGAAHLDTTAVLLLGDSHGTTGMVTGAIAQAAERGCVMLVSVGDFGIWPGDRGRWFLDEVTDAAQQHGMPVVVVPGNHDDYDQIDAAQRTEDDWIVLSDWVLAAPRGHVWHVARRPWMGFGGAASIDGPGGAWPQVRGPWLEGDLVWEWDHFGRPRQRRATRDADLGTWWPRERITDADVTRAIAASRRRTLGQRFDVLVTHDVPGSFKLEQWKDGLHWETGEEQRRRIQQVVDVIEPMITVSGHWHRFAHSDWVPWHPRGRGQQVVLAADVSEEGAQWVVIECNATVQPEIDEFGRTDQ